MISTLPRYAFVIIMGPPDQKKIGFNKDIRKNRIVFKNVRFCEKRKDYTR